MSKAGALAQINRATNSQEVIHNGLRVQATLLLELRRAIEIIEQELGASSMECAWMQDHVMDVYTEVVEGGKTLAAVGEKLAAMRKRLMSV